MRINVRFVLNSRLLPHGRGSSRLDGLAQPIFLTPEQWSDDSKCVQFFPYFREFKFFPYEHFVYGFHSDGEATQLDGKLDVRVFTDRVDAGEFSADAIAQNPRNRHVDVPRYKVVAIEPGGVTARPVP